MWYTPLKSVHWILLIFILREFYVLTWWYTWDYWDSVDSVSFDFFSILLTVVFVENPFWWGAPLHIFWNHSKYLTSPLFLGKMAFYHLLFVFSTTCMGTKTFLQYDPTQYFIRKLFSSAGSFTFSNFTEIVDQKIFK